MKAIDDLRQEGKGLVEYDGRTSRLGDAVN